MCNMIYWQKVGHPDRHFSQTLIMKIQDVNRPKGGNRFCGPAVISALVGCTTDEAARVLRTVSGKRAIKGTTTSEVISAFRHFGIQMKPHQRYKKANRPTLAGWLRDSVRERTAGRVFLLAAGNHWQLVSGRRYVCGRVLQVVSVAHEGVKRRSRVTSVHELFAPDGIIARPSVLAPSVLDKAKARERTQNNAARQRAKRLAAKYGIGIDTSDSQPGSLLVWVDPPEGMFENEEDDIFYGNHVAYDWGEVLELVEGYARHAESNGVKAPALVA